jgi:transposase
VSELLAAAQRRHRKPAPEKPPAPTPVLRGDVKERFDSRPAAPPKPERATPPKSTAKPTGRKPVPAHLETEEHKLRPTTCTHCGSGALDVADEIVEEKLHVVKEHQRRPVVRLTTCRCRQCGGRTTATSLPAPYERSKVTCEWLAWLVYQKFALLTPLDRIRRDLRERGIPMAISTLVLLIERAPDALASIDGLHWRKLLAGRWMATDGTGLKVLVPKPPSAHNGYIELYRNHEMAVFQYEPDKSGEVVATKLAPFCGTLTADAEHRFNGVYANGRVVESGCNAHGRRKFRDAEQAQPLLAVEGGAFIGAMYGEEEKAQKLGLVGDALREHRQHFIRPIADNFERWLDAIEPALVPSDPLMTAVRYYKNHRAALLRFIDDPDVPVRQGDRSDHRPAACCGAKRDHGLISLPHHQHRPAPLAASMTPLRAADTVSGTRSRLASWKLRRQREGESVLAHKCARALVRASPPLHAWTLQARGRAPSSVSFTVNARSSR